MYYLEVVQHPANGTFCKGTDATLTCIIFDNSTERVANSTIWVNLTSRATVQSNMITLISNHRHGDMVTSTLTIVDVSVYVNNTEYLCEPKFRIESSVAVIMIIGENSTHTYTCTHAHACIHIQKHTHTYTHNMHIQMHTHARTHTHTHMHTQHVHTYARTHTHTHTHTTLTHIRTRAHTHTHTHTHHSCPVLSCLPTA